jgi:ligand-binding sensor domain-containing protein
VALQCLLAGHSWALDPTRTLLQFNCRNWTPPNGLPADKINAITQTKDGYLWLGTESGLVCFDGFEFKAIPLDLTQGQDVRAVDWKNPEALQK